MNIFKLICNVLKKNQLQDSSEKPTEAELIHKSACVRAWSAVVDKRNRFLRPGGGFGHSSILNDFENAYDRAYIEVWNEHHRF